MPSSLSDAWFARAEAVIPGGVNSPSRSFKGVGGGTPVVMARGEGAYLVDVDGRRYIDYQAAYGPLVLGHAHPAVTDAVRRQAGEGTLTGSPHPLEIELAEQLTTAIPGLERVRIVSTGTEAVMSAVRLARAYTGRDALIKFQGAYHGHSDAMLVDAGSGVGTVGITTPAGIPAGVQTDVVVLPYNQLEPVRAFMERDGQRVAAILVEPVEGNMGLVEPEQGFLEGLHALARAHGALLIFDEVITAFRFHYGTAGSRCGVTPDLYCLGKTIGGGLPQGAYGGRADIMDTVAPRGPSYQAGTLAGNPLSAAAGLAALGVLRTCSPYGKMEALGGMLEEGLLRQASHHGVPVVINRVGGMFTLFFSEAPVRDYAAALRSDAARFARFYQALLIRGIYLAPSRLECWFVSAVHTEREIDATLTATGEAFGEL
jgi:glutamate-1-semialdehyde 2,1-aminomutase